LDDGNLQDGNLDDGNLDEDGSRGPREMTMDEFRQVDRAKLMANLARDRCPVPTSNKINTAALGPLAVLRMDLATP
jgi:hypothetical protein